MTRNKLLLTCGILLTVLVVITGWVALGGGGNDTADGKNRHSSPSPSVSGKPPSPSPVPTYTQPPDWTEPQRWADLPRGARTDSHGNEVAFPHTAEGALAMLCASAKVNIHGSFTGEDQQLAIYDSYIAREDKSADMRAKVAAGGRQADQQLRSGLGVPAKGPYPPGAYERMNAIGFKVIAKSKNEVTAYVLVDVISRAGETSKANHDYARDVLGASWVDGDWKQTSKAMQDAKSDSQGQTPPGLGAPGDKAFNIAGWTAIREAS